MVEEKKDTLLDNISELENELPDKKEWEKPTLEDVSEQIMAQPYIRFT